MNKKTKKFWWIGTALVILLIGGVVGGTLYKVFLKPNINAGQHSYKYLYVTPGESWDQVIEQLNQEGWLLNEQSFRLCLRTKQEFQPQCGKYDLGPDISNRDFMNRLAYGMDNKAKISLKMTRYTTWVARNLAKQVEIDSASIAEVLLQDTLLHRLGLTQENSMAMFVRFESQVPWCISAEELQNEIERQYNKFWNDERREKAKKTGLSLPEIHTLASIIEEETNDYEDRRMAAGLYLNRIRKHMPLQACPTVRYATGDFSLRRVLKKHTQLESPYNTYKYAGLPPGPIRIPSANAIDAVLNFVPHNYLYMCAKPDFSGTHNYASTYSQHARNARIYQRALNARKIYK